MAGYNAVTYVDGIERTTETPISLFGMNDSITSRVFATALSRSSFTMLTSYCGANVNSKAALSTRWLIVSMSSVARPTSLSLKASIDGGVKTKTMLRDTASLHSILLYINVENEIVPRFENL